MKNKSKKFISKLFSLTCIMTLLVTFLVCPVASSSETTEPFDYALFLNRMGISAIWDEDSFITRGDFTVLAVQTLNIGTLTNDRYFSDVSDVQGQYINTAAQMGLVSRNEEGLFYPDRLIVTEEALTICMRILGYGELLAEEPYPAGYLSYAAKLKLLNNHSNGEKLTGADATKLIYETLGKKFIEIDVNQNPEKSKYYLSNITYQEKHFGLYKVSGTVQSIWGLSLGGITPVGKNKILISGIEYDNPHYAEFSSYTYLGCPVNFYILAQDETPKVIYIRRMEETKSIDSNDVESVIGFNATDTTSVKKQPTLKYYDFESDDIETVTFEPDSTVLINGVVSNYVSNETFKPNFGKIYITDSNSDGIYDVILIEQYDYYKIDYYNKKFGYLNDLYGKEVIRLFDFDQEHVVVVSGGKEMTSDAIPSKGVLQVMCTYDRDGKIDYNGFVRVMVTNNQITGKINQVDETFLYINGEAYRTLPKLWEQLSVRVGYETTFTIGENNVIIDYVNFKDTKAMEYAYLIAIGQEGILNYDYTFLIVSDKNEFLQLKLSDDFRYTGPYNGTYTISRKLQDKEIANVITPYQLVKVKLDKEGKIELLESAYDHSMEEDYKGFDTSTFSLDYHDSCQIYSAMLGSDYRSSGNVIYFYVSTNSMNPEDFVVGDWHTEGFEYSSPVKIKIYDAGIDLEAKVVVLENVKNGGTLPDTMISSGTTGVVEQIVQKMRKDGTVGYFARINQSGGTQVLAPVNDDLAPINSKYFNIPTTVTKFSELEPGDLVTCYMNREGYIFRYVVLNEYNKLPDEDKLYLSYSHLKGVEDWGAIRLAEGTVKAFYPGGHFVVDTDNRKNLKCNLSTSGAIYYEYDCRRQKASYLSSVPNLNIGDYVCVYLSREATKIVVKYVQ